MIHVNITNMVWVCGLDFSGSGQFQVEGCFEHSTEPSCSKEAGEFPNQLSNCQFLKKDYIAYSGLVNMRVRACVCV
jgi:hypothetical protein